MISDDLEMRTQPIISPMFPQFRAVVLMSIATLVYIFIVIAILRLIVPAAGGSLIPPLLAAIAVLLCCLIIGCPIIMMMFVISKSPVSSMLWRTVCSLIWCFAIGVSCVVYHVLSGSFIANYSNGLSNVLMSRSGAEPIEIQLDKIGVTLGEGYDAVTNLPLSGAFGVFNGHRAFVSVVALSQPARNTDIVVHWSYSWGDVVMGSEASPNLRLRWNQADANLGNGAHLTVTFN